MEKPPDTVTLLAFAGAVLLGGGNAVAVWFSNGELAPFWGAFLRFLLAGAIFAGVGAALRLPLPRGRALVGAALYGVLAFFLSYACAYWAIGRVPPGLAQIILALVPLATILIATVVGQERFRWAGLLGALLSLAGIALIFWARLARDASAIGLIVILVAVLAFAVSGIVLKHYPTSHVVATNAVAMLVGAALLLALSIASGEARAVPSTRQTWTALAFLVVVGSVGMFWLFVFVLQRWTASAVAFDFVLTPLVTVPLSAWLTGESLTWTLAVGGALVLVGVYVGAVWRPRIRAPAIERAPG